MGSEASAAPAVVVVAVAASGEQTEVFADPLQEADS